MCKNSTANNNWCKSEAEIVQFLKDTPFFFVHQQTHVQADMFSDSKKIEGFPYFGDSKNYFPTVWTQRSIDYGPI